MHMTKIYDCPRDAEREINKLCEQGWKIKEAKLHGTGGGQSYGVEFRYLYVLEKV